MNEEPLLCVLSTHASCRVDGPLGSRGVVLIRRKQPRIGPRRHAARRADSFLDAKTRVRAAICAASVIAQDTGGAIRGKGAEKCSWLGAEAAGARAGDDEGPRRSIAAAGTSQRAEPRLLDAVRCSDARCGAAGYFDNSPCRPDATVSTGAQEGE